MHQRGRQWDEYGRFLLQKSINVNEEIEKEEVELPFEDASPIFPTESSSREQLLDTSGIWPFAEILASFLDDTTFNPPVVNNPVPSVHFQHQPQNLMPLVMAQPTFQFPLASLVTNANLKNIPPTTLPKLTEDPDTFLFDFDILCHNFDYKIDAHKLKLFPAT